MATLDSFRFCFAIGLLAATSASAALNSAVLRLEGNTSLTFDSGSNQNVWANTGTGGSAYDAKDRVTGATGSVTQETYTLTDGFTTAKRMVFNGSTSGFQSAYQANQLADLTVYVVMSKDTDVGSGYENIWSFDNPNGGYSRGMGYENTSGKLLAQTKTSTALTLADSSSVVQVWVYRMRGTTRKQSTPTMAARQFPDRKT